MSMNRDVAVVVPPSTRSGYVDWGSIVGGALLASACSFVLFSFGSAAGIASVSPYSWNNPSPTTLTVISVLWFVLVIIGSFILGGYVAGRLRQPVGDAAPEERTFRDGAHGLLVWALGLIIGVSLAVMVVSGAVRTAANIAGQAGAAAASTAVTTASSPTAQETASSLIDTILRPAAGRPDPASARPEDVRGELTRLLGQGFVRGEISPADRTYIAGVVAARTGVPQQEAEQRVDAAIQQAKQAAEIAKAAANKARKAAAILGFLIAVTSLVAAAAAFWAATVGGNHRDDSRLAKWW